MSEMAKKKAQGNLLIMLEGCINYRVKIFIYKVLFMANTTYLTPVTHICNIIEDLNII